MLALPHLSATELVTTLERLGFRTQTRANGLATMCRSSRCVTVPETATLSPALLGAILRAADVEPFEFVSEIDRRFPHPKEPAPAVA
jgi:predicted RNA binding protein YcfA (HicA-like mRNA interferase family)